MENDDEIFDLLTVFISHILQLKVFFILDTRDTSNKLWNDGYHLRFCDLNVYSKYLIRFFSCEMRDVRQNIREFSEVF